MGVSGVQNGSPPVNNNNEHRCRCVDDLLAPIRSKMKVLKKIKKRIRLTPRNGSTGANNLPPILFHQVHGNNIRIYGEGRIARRIESFCKGVTFSSRPIKIQEKVYVKFLEVSNNWSGVIRFGFTSIDPSNLRCNLPKYACPDLTNKPGYWAKALAERFAEKDTILFYYVTQAGDVHFGINGEEKGIFFTGVETRGSLWAMFDVYGNSTGIELVDHRTPLNNLRRNGSGDSGPDIVAHMIPSLQSLFIQNPNQRSERENQTDCTIISRYQMMGIELSPLTLHRTRGQNVIISNDRCLASRIDTEFCRGYVFTSRPVRLGEEIIIQVLKTESMYSGGLAFGLTSCDPSSLQTADLPDDADSLLDRPEYWVVQKDVANVPQTGDELAFSVLPTGEVQVSKNRGPPVVVMHVDQTLQLWAFFDLYGSTQKIRVVGAANSRQCRNSSPAASQLPFKTEPSRLRVNLPCPRDQSYESGSHLVNGNSAQVPLGQSNGVPHRLCCASGNTSTTQSTTVASPSAELVQLQPTMSGGTVLVVNIPPAQSNHLNHQQQQQQQQQQQTPPRRTPPACYNHYNHGAPNNSAANVDRGTLMSNYSNTYIEPVSATAYSTMNSSHHFGDIVTAATAAPTTPSTTSSECSICYERTIDSVLYMCGHMCMCYECAVQQWRGKGGGHCPLCRAVIKDVIRTYKS